MFIANYFHSRKAEEKEKNDFLKIQRYFIY